MLYAERYQTELDNNQEMVIPRSVAASYLCKYSKEEEKKGLYVRLIF